MTTLSTVPTDVIVLRDLAKRYVEVAADPIQNQRRDLWRRHNRLKPTRPLLYLRGGEAWNEVPEITTRKCADSLFQSVERNLRYLLFRAAMGDDSIFEPWFVVSPVYSSIGWGVEGTHVFSEESFGSYKIDYPINDLDADLEKLRMPSHAIDEAATRQTFDRITDAIGDILPVVLDRGPCYRMWGGDLSTALGHLRGIEHFMLDMMDNPAGLHRLMAFLRDGILAVHEQAEAAGDWSTLAHENQAMPYAEELPDPAADSAGVSRSELWGYQAAQEFTLVSPAMHEEFLLEYQLPILEKFGLVAYGCCEDLTRKIDMLRRRVKNLRRIAVSPMADAKTCIEQIGEDYVISWRPSPAEMVCTGFDADRVRRVTRETLRMAQGLHIDITLKDVQTVQNDPRRLQEWTRITREVADEFA
ncbi:MAG: hypothetical protein JXA11_11030 [Phycisphaerae bacterium]|nr:hypothetical protein [Phycisphaerae bacterium]